MSIEQLVHYYKDTDLSGNDIIKMIGKPPVLYSDLRNYKNLNALLGDKEYAIILYQTSSKTTGHFVCLFIRDGVIHFQDSYGFRYDTEQQYTQYDEKLPRYLTMLIEGDGRPIVWSKHDYQSKRSTVATCGRWSCVRILLKSISNMDFQHVFYNNKDAYLTSDNLVVMLTLIGLNDINQYFLKH